MSYQTIFTKIMEKELKKKILLFPQPAVWQCQLYPQPLAQWGKQLDCHPGRVWAGGKGARAVLLGRTGSGAGNSWHCLRQRAEHPNQAGRWGSGCKAAWCLGRPRSRAQDEEGLLTTADHRPDHPCSPACLLRAGRWQGAHRQPPARAPPELGHVPGIPAVQLAEAASSPSACFPQDFYP